MRQLFLCLGLVVLAAGVASCGSEDPAGTTGPSNSGGNSSTSMTGTITDVVSGAPVSGVAVALQSATATTGSDGRYTITGLTAAGNVTLTAQHQGHVNFSQGVTIASGANTTNVRITPSNAARMAGNWTGTWRNTTFSTTGGITMTVTTDTILQSMQVRLDVNGGVFGLADPPAETFTGNYTPAAGASLTRTSTVFGNVSVTVTPTGQITGSATGVPVASISRLDFTGTATATTITLAYTVTFVGGGTAVGTATLTK